MSENIFAMLANANLNDVDTSYPVLQAGVYEWEIKSAEKKTSERTGGEYLLFDCALITSTAVDVNGSPVSPGYKMRHMISLTPSNKQILASICKFLDAIQTTREWDETLESYVGLTFFAKTKVGKERTDKNSGDVYPPSTEFAQFLPKQ